MAKVNIKFGKITLFGVFFHVRDTEAFGLKRSSRIIVQVSTLTDDVSTCICHKRHYNVNFKTKEY